MLSPQPISEKVIDEKSESALVVDRGSRIAGSVVRMDKSNSEARPGSEKLGLYGTRHGSGMYTLY